MDYFVARVIIIRRRAAVYNMNALLCLSGCNINSTLLVILVASLPLNFPLQSNSFCDIVIFMNGSSACHVCPNLMCERFG